MKVLLGTKVLMAQGAVRKLGVCIFDECERGVESLVEKLLLDIHVEPRTDEGDRQGPRRSSSPHRFPSSRLQVRHARPREQAPMQLVKRYTHGVH